MTVNLPRLHPLVRWWFKRYEWDRDGSPFAGNWGINHLNFLWHMGTETGRLPALPSSPMEQWPRRFRLALDTIVRDPFAMQRLIDDDRQERLLDAVGRRSARSL